jgi:hypothetical protein
VIVRSVITVVPPLFDPPSGRLECIPDFSFSFCRSR